MTLISWRSAFRWRHTMALRAFLGFVHTLIAFSEVDLVEDARLMFCKASRLFRKSDLALQTAVGSFVHIVYGCCSLCASHKFSEVACTHDRAHLRPFCDA